LRGSLSALVEGSEEAGFRLPHLNHDIVAKADFGIHTVVASGISLDHAFGGPLSAENVAKILYSLREGSTKRIQDICNETGMHISVPGRHLALLAEMGIVDFQGYDAPRFSWNPEIKSFAGVVEQIKSNIPFKASNYRVQRAIEVAKQLYHKRKMKFNLTEVESLIADRFACGGYNRNLTAGALRNLERIGYILASNMFIIGDTHTQVRAVYDEQGQNPLIDFVVVIKGEKGIPSVKVGYQEVRAAIDIFKDHYTFRSSPEHRKHQIVTVLSGKEAATRREIAAEINIRPGSVFSYLQELEEQRMVTHQKIKNVHYYSVLR